MFFFQMPSVNYSEVIVQSRSPFSFVPGGISQGQLSGASCSGGNYSGENVLVAKVQEKFHGRQFPNWETIQG